MTLDELNTKEYSQKLDAQTRTTMAWGCFFIACVVTGAAMTVVTPWLFQHHFGVFKGSVAIVIGATLAILGCWMILQTEPRRNVQVGVSGLVLASIGGLIVIGAVLYLALLNDFTGPIPDPIVDETDSELRGAV